MWHNVEQDIDGEWGELRKGKVTGSAISKIMSYPGKPFGEPAKKLAVNIAVFNCTGGTDTENYTNEHMKRGIAQEPLARALYEEQYFYDVTNGGFYDNRITGCSPDGLVGDNGLIEIKSVIATTHFATIKRDDIDPAYKWQCVFNLHQSRREWIDFVSYCAIYPDSKKLFVKRKSIEDFKDYFELMEDRLSDFFHLVDDYMERIK
jgi:hypothetical protein